MEEQIQEVEINGSSDGLQQKNKKAVVGLTAIVVILTVLPAMLAFMPVRTGLALLLIRASQLLGPLAAGVLYTRLLSKLASSQPHKRVGDSWPSSLLLCAAIGLLLFALYYFTGRPAPITILGNISAFILPFMVFQSWNFYNSLFAVKNTEQAEAIDQQASQDNDIDTITAQERIAAKQATSLESRKRKEEFKEAKRRKEEIRRREAQEKQAAEKESYERELKEAERRKEETREKEFREREAHERELKEAERRKEEIRQRELRDREAAEKEAQERELKEAERRKEETRLREMREKEAIEKEARERELKEAERKEEIRQREARVKEAAEKEAHEQELKKQQEEARQKAALQQEEIRQRIARENELRKLEKQERLKENQRRQEESRLREAREKEAHEVELKRKQEESIREMERKKEEERTAVSREAVPGETMQTSDLVSEPLNDPATPEEAEQTAIAKDGSRKGNIWLYSKPDTEQQPVILLNSVVLYIQLSVKSTGDEEVFASSAPLGMKLGDFFNHFINIKKRTGKPEFDMTDEQQQFFGWKFFTKGFLKFTTRELDPDLSLQKNRLKEASIIVAKRTQS